MSGHPPVTSENLRTCKRLLTEFAAVHSIPQPIAIEWTEHKGVVRFIEQHEGRVFGIGTPKAQ